MIYQKQLFRHDPPNSWGDCYRTCIASLLDLPADQVPHVYDKGQEEPEAGQELDKFLKPMGLKWMALGFACPDGEPNSLFHGMQVWNAGVPYAFGGISRNGTSHLVIACDGKVIMDPALDNSGIVAPDAENTYWVYLLVRRTEI